MVSLTVCRVPNEQLALSNRFFCNPRQFPLTVFHILLQGRQKVTLERSNDIQMGGLGTSLYQRRWLALSEGASVAADPITDNDVDVLCSLTLELSLVNRNANLERQQEISQPELTSHLHSALAGTLLSPDQPLIVSFEGSRLLAKVTALTNFALVATGDCQYTAGCLSDQTAISLSIAGNSSKQISLKAAAIVDNAILKDDFCFQDLGVGGLDAEFKTLFRRAFASRIFPAAVCKKAGIVHTRGILLHGPPGTGKTLMARQIGKMLRAREPLVVNGPEVLSRYVGASEENVRALFAPAEKEQAERGDESLLHIVIFDEIDAICKRRGSRSDSTGVSDSIVNQLLSKMDGVNSLSNLLVIGMTNRKDLLDDALLRPGRFGVCLEIGLPDEAGRLQILKIHTRGMRSNGILDPMVDLGVIAGKTVNYSGAELMGLVQDAASFALERNILPETFSSPNSEATLTIRQSDFDLALSEIHPAFGSRGVSLTEKAAFPYGVIRWTPQIDRLLEEASELTCKLLSSASAGTSTLLLHSSGRNSGRTSLAWHIAEKTGFTFKRFLTVASLPITDAARIEALQETFSDAMRCDRSVIVLDDIERLFNWSPVGTRYSDRVLDAIGLLLGRARSNLSHRLLVIATTREPPSLLQDSFGLNFECTLAVPLVRGPGEISLVLQQVCTQLGTLGEWCLPREGSIPGSAELGVNRLIQLIERASVKKTPEDRLQSLVEGILLEG